MIARENWHDIYGLRDIDIYHLMKSCDLDILIDLSGHGFLNKISVCIMRPAQVIITYLGFPSSTYLSEIDYRITDKYADSMSESNMNKYSEKLVFMPRTFLCYRLFPNEKIPEIDPTLNNNFVIGILNKSSKHHHLMVSLWKKIVQIDKNIILLIKLDNK
jgi:predicted O-linked N-acetylglucosamine transferase (SPINDLY family)